MWCSCPILSFYRWRTWGSKRWSVLSVVAQLLGGGPETRVPISPLVQGMNAKQSSDPKHWGILYFIKWTIYGNQPTTQLQWHTVGVLWCKIQSSLKIKCSQIASETRHLASLQQYKSLKFQRSLSSDTNFLRVPKLSVNTRNQSSQNETNSKEKHKKGKKLWRAYKHYKREFAELTQAFISLPTNPTSLELLLASPTLQ